MGDSKKTKGLGSSWKNYQIWGVGGIKKTTCCEGSSHKLYIWEIHICTRTLSPQLFRSTIIRPEWNKMERYWDHITNLTIAIVNELSFTKVHRICSYFNPPVNKAMS